MISKEGMQTGSHTALKAKHGVGKSFIVAAREDVDRLCCQSYYLIHLTKPAGQKKTRVTSNHWGDFRVDLSLLLSLSLFLVFSAMEVICLDDEGVAFRLFKLSKQQWFSFVRGGGIYMLSRSIQAILTTNQQILKNDFKTAKINV